MEQHHCITPTSSSGPWASRLEVVFAQRHHHHWSSVRSWRLSANRAFPVAATTSRLHCLGCGFSEVVRKHFFHPFYSRLSVVPVKWLVDTFITFVTYLVTDTSNCGRWCTVSGRTCVGCCQADGDGIVHRHCPAHLEDSDLKPNITCAVYNHDGTGITTRVIFAKIWLVFADAWIQLSVYYNR